MSGRAMLRVAAAENPSIKWGGSDVSAYTVSAQRKSAAGPKTGENDVFGRSLQVTNQTSLGEDNFLKAFCLVWMLWKAYHIPPTYTLQSSVLI